MKGIDKILELIIMFSILIVLRLLGLFPVYVVLIMGIVVVAINDEELKKVFSWMVLPLSIIEDIVNVQLLGLTLVMTICSMLLIHLVSKFVSDIGLRIIVGMILGHMLAILVYWIVNMIFLNKNMEFGFIGGGVSSIVVGIITGIIYSKIHNNSLTKVRV